MATRKDFMIKLNVVPVLPGLSPLVDVFRHILICWPQSESSPARTKQYEAMN